MNRLPWYGVSALMIAAGAFELRSLAVYLRMTSHGGGWTIFAPGAYESLRDSSLLGAALLVSGIGLGLTAAFRGRSIFGKAR